MLKKKVLELELKNGRYKSVLSKIIGEIKNVNKGDTEL